AGRSATREFPVGAESFGTDFLMRLDKALYNGGDTIDLSLLGGGSQPVFVDFLKDGQTVRTEVVELSGGEAKLAIDLPAAWSGSMELCAYRFLADGLPARQVRSFFVRPAQRLSIDLTSDKSEYRPGEKAKLTMSISDNRGKPTPGAISLAAVDEAVFAVLEQMPGLERTFFLLEQDRLKPVYAIYNLTPDEVF